jgi:hypothetical protein
VDVRHPRSDATVQATVVITQNGQSRTLSALATMPGGCGDFFC